MEEILASIRRIISEDDAPPSTEDAKPGDQPLAAEPAAEPEPAPEPEPEPEALEDVLELTERVEDEKPAETVGDLDVFSKTPDPEPEPIPEPAPPPPAPEPVAAAPAPEPEPAALVGAAAAAATATAFSQLSAAIAMPAGQTTLEDVVRELLKPLLKSWLDENLPRIVQAQVEEEVQRIARSRVR